MPTWRNANCYGYATRQNAWVCFDSDYKYSVEELLELFPTWRSVKKTEMKLGHNYVAYRYGHEDFHFMHRDKQGHWTHKPGSCPVEAISTEKVFADSWVSGEGTLYNSKLYLFEVS